MTYEVVNGKCMPIQTDASSNVLYHEFYVIVAIYIPLFFILLSYIVISTILEVEKRIKQTILDTRHPITSSSETNPSDSCSSRDIWPSFCHFSKHYYIKDKDTQRIALYSSTRVVPLDVCCQLHIICHHHPRFQNDVQASIQGIYLFHAVVLLKKITKRSHALGPKK